MNEPKHGQHVLWRFKGSKEWHHGFAYDERAQGVIRMGNWNGDLRGMIVSVNEIEWKEVKP